MEKLPPLEKIYEAWSAIADGRVEILSPVKAIVTSSDGTRSYMVIYDPDTDTYYSNDNATFWQGYPGYPVIAVMMVRGLLPLDMTWAQQWEGINWNALNAAHNRDYAAAVDQVERERGINHTEATEKAQAVMSTLGALPSRVSRLTAAMKE